MKICCCINTLAAGGKERVMSSLINGFVSDYGAEVHVVLYGIKPEVFYDIDEKAIIHTPQFKPGRNRLLLTLKTLAYLRKEIKKVNPDTILNLGEIWNSFILLALIGTDYPIYISDRCRPNKSFGFFHDALRKWLYPKAKGVIAQTNKAKECYIEWFQNNNITVIGNPINDIEIPKDNVREKIVLSVGRLLDTKHFDQLISIFADINNPDWKLIIVGGEANNQKNMGRLQEQIVNIGLSERIELAGTRKNVVDYLLKAELFAFTSSSEGFPNVVGEALSAGLPVVAYDCIAGPSDMIQNGVNGYLIELFDQEQFKLKLQELMEDEDLRNRMREQAQASMQKYELPKIVDDYYRFITAEL